ncbi:MAG: AMP-binding protein [Deltaproteobacteria bacterium]
MNIAEILAVRAQSQPDVPAIIEGIGRRVRRTTFARLDSAAAQAAGLLRDAGLRAGDPALILQPMSTELYVALAAIFRLGLVAMFVDPAAGREHVERCCALERPRALIAATRAHLLRLRSPALRAISKKFVIGPPVPGAVRWSRAALAAPCEAIVPCPPEAPALVTFTSGSTGEPKAALRSHGFLHAQHRILADALQLKAGDVDLTTMPIVLLANLASGVTSLLPAVDLRYPGAIDPAPVVAQIGEHQPVSSAASPAFFERLARHGAQRSLALPSLRKLFTGGAPVFPRLLEGMQRLAPLAEVQAVYGSTEAEPIARIALDEIEPADREAMRAGRGLLAGAPVGAIRVAILPDRWGTRIGPFASADFVGECLPANRPGEIVVSGEHVLPGYLHGRDEQATKFRVDGAVWHRTGDAGYFDDRGRLWLLGRCAARIADGNGVLYPLAAEACAVDDPRIHRAALVARDGRRILAVELADPQDRPERAFLDGHRRRARVDEVRVCREIPVDRRHNAKIDYLRLERMMKST